MNILVIGSGAREHTLVWKLAQSPQVREIYAAPGNAGTALIARNLPLSPLDFPSVLKAVIDRGVDMVVVGPEEPLAQGIVDYLEGRRIPTFGPTQAGAQIEASKSFAKELMMRIGIPCARGEAFDSPQAAKAYVQKQSLPVVVKADGLAAGKGVVVAFTLEEALEAIEAAMERRVFGPAGDRIVIEEYMSGLEVSLLAFTDGETVLPMVPACDYKRVNDGDEGPNTGGMGSYSPPGFFGPDMVEQARRTILEPTVRALAKEGIPYRGALYAGLMVTQEGPKVVEFNCRFGDPETQVILPLLKTDLVDIMRACGDGTLGKLKAEWSNEGCVGVVLASEGYPGPYETGFSITGLDRLDDGVRVFHAGTRARKESFDTGWRYVLGMGGRPQKNMDELFSGMVETSGGRVLTVVATGSTLAQAREKVYANVLRIQFVGCHYRTDIAAREE